MQVFNVKTFTQTVLSARRQRILKKRGFKCLTLRKNKSHALIVLTITRSIGIQNNANITLCHKKSRFNNKQHLKIRPMKKSRANTTYGLNV